MKYIIGADEVGYGAWAGPLVVCAVAVPVGWTGPRELNDSKQLTAAERVALYGELQHVETAIMGAENTVIDELGVKHALVAAFRCALHQLLAKHPDAEVIVDGIVPIPGVPQGRCVPRADETYPAVMAASVIAKVNRDFVMRAHHKQFPHYGWDTNVGYGGGKNHAHTRGLKKHGVCPLHRRSYAPIKAALAAWNQPSLFEEP